MYTLFLAVKYCFLPKKVANIFLYIKYFFIVSNNLCFSLSLYNFISRCLSTVYILCPRLYFSPSYSSFSH